MFPYGLFDGMCFWINSVTEKRGRELKPQNRNKSILTKWGSYPFKMFQKKKIQVPGVADKK